jgi:hypothetical protein
MLIASFYCLFAAWGKASQNTGDKIPIAGRSGAGATKSSGSQTKKTGKASGEPLEFPAFAVRLSDAYQPSLRPNSMLRGVLLWPVIWPNDVGLLRVRLGPLIWT